VDIARRIGIAGAARIDRPMPVTPTLYERERGMGEVNGSFRMFRLGNNFVVESLGMRGYVILLGYFSGAIARQKWTSADHEVRISLSPRAIAGSSA
jgi:hypothetical protein